MTEETIEIDGSFGEGGGQIVRTAVALSAVTGKAVKINNIRAKRPNPGLSWQHITAIDAVRKLCNASIYGLKKGSPTLEFKPYSLKGGSFKFDVGTAGSITLVLQACLLPALFCDRTTEITITGGTDVAWSPPMDYFRFVFLNLLKKMGADVDIKLVRRGYYPRGGGLVKVNIQQINKLLPLKTVRGTLKDIIGYAHISNLPLDVMHRLKSSMYGKLNDNMKKHLKVIEEINSYPAFDKGAAIVLCAYFENTIIGTSQLGKKGVRAEDLGSAVGEELTNYLEKDVNVDIYAADQLLPYLALCTEECELNVSEITLHTATNIALIKKFIDCDITVRENDVKKIYIK